MTSGGSPLLSVRAEARQLVAPDYAVVDGLIEHTARSKVEAMQSVTGSLDRLTADLAALGAVPFDEGAGRRPLTWLAYSSATREELYHDTETRQMERTGQVTATVTLRVTVRDLDRLDDLSGVLAAQPGLNVHTARGMAFRASGGDQPGTPALTPVPQELIATIEARFRTTDVSLPNT